MLRLAVFASGGGSNLQALIDHFNHRNSEAARVCLVLSDRADAGALARAERAGIPGCMITVAGRSESDVAEQTHAQLERAQIDLIALAGYLKMIPASVVRAYRHRMVNIHPALLPAFGGKGMYGLHVHRAVIESGCSVTGVTVHQVDERYDEGRPLVQWPVPVLAGDTPEMLAARVLRVEHVVYPLALDALARRIAADPRPEVGENAGGFRMREPVAFTMATEDLAVALSAAVRRALGLDREGM